MILGHSHRILARFWVLRMIKHLKRLRAIKIESMNTFKGFQVGGGGHRYWERKYNCTILWPKDTPENCMFLPSNMKFSYMRELLFSQPREKTNILVETRIAFLGRELHLGKSTKNSLNLWQTRITQRNVILVGIVWESLILVWFLDENYIKPRRELSFSLLENDNSRLNIVILPLIRGENHVIRGTITVSPWWRFS